MPVEKAIRRSIRILDAELAQMGLAEALCRIDIGVFALDASGSVVFSNSNGQLLIGDRLQLDRDRLQIGSGAVRIAIENAINKTIRASSSGKIPEPQPILVHSAGNNRFVVCPLPVISTKNSGAQQTLLRAAHAIVLVIERKSHEPKEFAIIRDLLGLTPGEARVAVLVGAGVAPKDTAQRLGIAEETVRNVLKRVFAKVGVSRQIELVALLGKLVYR